MYIFLTFILCALVLGSKLVGPLSIRVYATILLILYMVLLKKKEHSSYLHLKSYPIVVYICFLVYLLIVKFFSQEFVSNINELPIFFSILFCRNYRLYWSKLSSHIARRREKISIVFNYTCTCQYFYFLSSI